MSVGRVAHVALAVTVITASAARPVRAQSSEAPSDARLQFGSLTVAPVIQLTSVGYDSNVFNLSDLTKVGDFTAVVSPSVAAKLRMPHIRLNVSSQFDFFYYKELTDLRSVNTNTTARVDMPLNRLTPYVVATLANTQNPLTLEIDAIARRRSDSVSAGADLRLTGKVSAGMYALRSRLEYDPNSIYRGSDLGHELNYTETGEGFDVRYALTPLTTFVMNITRQRARYDSSPLRDSDSVLVMPTVEFSPFALVSGRASFGYQKRTILTGDVPDFNGPIGLVDLTYTLLGRTRFVVGAPPQLQSSLPLRATGICRGGGCRLGHAPRRRLVGRRWKSWPDAAELYSAEATDESGGD